MGRAGVNTTTRMITAVFRPVLLALPLSPPPGWHYHVGPNGFDVYVPATDSQTRHYFAPPARMAIRVREKYQQYAYAPRIKNVYVLACAVSIRIPVLATGLIPLSGIWNTRKLINPYSGYCGDCAKNRCALSFSVVAVAQKRLPAVAKANSKSVRIILGKNGVSSPNVKARTRACIQHVTIIVVYVRASHVHT